MQQKFLTQSSLFALLITSLSYATSSKEVLFSDQTTYTTITTQTTISTPGHYLLGNNLSISSGDGITINASDVVLDLDKRVIDGTNGGSNGVTIASGHKNIIVGNGIIRAMGSNGILVQSDQCTILHCDCNQNATGFSVSSANNVVIDDCQAISNTSNGFSLNGCTNSIVRNSSALKTGSTGASYGFISAGGSYNHFDNCIARGTNTHTPIGLAHALAHVAAHQTQHVKAKTPTSLAVGFMLDTTEFGSSIINCKSDDTNTPSGDVANPYGINLGTTFDTTLNKLTSSTNGIGIVRASAWNADGSLFAAGGDKDGDQSLVLYRFNGKRLDPFTIEADRAITYAVDWSREGSYLAIGSTSGFQGFTTKIYALHDDQLEFVTGDNFTTVTSVHWAPDGKHLVAGDMAGNINIYSFDGDLITLLATANFGASVNAVRWSPTGNNIAVGGAVSSGVDIQVYSFSGSSLTLQASANQGATVNAIDWSTDGNYVAIGADPSSSIDTQIYSYSGSSLTLTASASHGASVRSVHFSPDDRYVATAGDTESVNSSEINLYAFSSGSLTSLGFTVFGNNAYTSNWLPHQRYYSVAGDFTENNSNFGLIHNLRVYQLGLSGVSNCTVKNNVVSNTTGSFNTGIGIRADALNNFIADNHSHSNDINYQYTTNINALGLFSSPTRIQNIGVPPR